MVAPVAQVWARRAAILLCVGLHTSIALLIEAGPFSYAMMCWGLLLVGPADWAALERLGRRVLPRLGRLGARLGAGRVSSARASASEEASRASPPLAAGARHTRWAWARAGARWIGAAALCLIAAASVDQLLAQNFILPEPLRVSHRPALLAAVADSLRMGQGWRMFAPQPPMMDGDLVVDGVLPDGTHVDPFTGRAPDFDEALHGALDYGEPWCVFSSRMGDEGSRPLWHLFEDYLKRIDTLPDAKIHAPLQRFAVYWVSNRPPPPGSATPTELRRKLLFAGAGRP